MDSALSKRLSSYWAERLGVADLSGPAVVPHAVALEGYSGVYAAFFHEGVVVSVPPRRVAEFAVRLRPHNLSELMDPLRLEALVPGVEQIIGPAYIGYTSKAPDARRIDVDVDVSERDLAALRADVHPREWDDASLGGSTGPIFGRFIHAELQAASTYQVIGQVAHIGVLTRSEARRCGYGTEVVAAAARHALAAGLIPQYQTLDSNTGSRAIASRLGFERFVTSIALRLRAV